MLFIKMSIIVFLQMSFIMACIGAISGYEKDDPLPSLTFVIMAFFSLFIHVLMVNEAIVFFG